MSALEDEWEKPIQIRIVLSGSVRRPQLTLAGHLMEMSSENGGVKPWVSFQRTMRSGDDGDIAAVLLALLYGLDYEATARKEREGPETA